jgi:peptidoglycan-N-acetylglucosamine deacetylase
VRSRRGALCLIASFSLPLGCAAGVAVASAGPPTARLAVADPSDSGGSLDLASARVRQRHGRLVLDAGTRGPWALDQLTRFPDPADPAQAFLCLQLHQRGRESQLCLGPRGRGDANLLAFSLPRPVGQPRSRRLLGARLSRPTAASVHVSFALRAAGLRPGRLGWALAARSADPSCSAPGSPSCTDRVPDGGELVGLGIDPTRPTGCTSHEPRFVTRGPRARKRIAIGFDDGPGTYTPAVLRVLRRFGSHATFFEIGQETGGRGAIMRRILNSGNEIGNHSLHHEAYPSSGSLAETNRLIAAATGFRPCLFRPPGGAVNGALLGRASAQRMTTVDWDVDPRDWAAPGVGAIASSVIAHARRGSIVVMHDGGGPRGQTVAALPAILSHFRHRGYRFVTVTELLGNRFTY